MAPGGPFGIYRSVFLTAPWGLTVRRRVVISDQSGTPISEGRSAVVTIRFRDKRKATRVLDLTDEEAERLGGRQLKRRGVPNN